MRILGTFFIVGIICAAANTYAGETQSLLFGEPDMPPTTTQAVEVKDPEPSPLNGAGITGATPPKTSILEADFPTAPDGDQKEDVVPKTESAMTVSGMPSCHAPCAAPRHTIWRCARYMPRHCFRGCGPCAPMMVSACEPSACAPVTAQYRKITKEITYEVKVPYQEVCTRTYLVQVPRWEMRPTQVAQVTYPSTACVPAACTPPVSACEAVAEVSDSDTGEEAAADCVIRTHTVMKPYCTMVPEERTQQYTVWKWKTEIRKCIVEEIVCN